MLGNTDPNNILFELVNHHHQAPWWAMTAYICTL